MFLSSTLAYNSFSKDNLPTQTEQSLESAQYLLTNSEKQSTKKVTTLTSDPQIQLPLSGATPYLLQNLKTYQVQEGDTLSGLAEKFGISTLTLRNANNLETSTLKVGQVLVILPGNGRLIKTDSHESLEEVAKHYKTSTDQLIADNALADATSIPEMLFCYNCALPEQHYAVASVKIEKIITPEASVPPTPDDNIAGGNTFPEGFCTFYVAKKMLIKFGGDAKYWLTNAKKAGYKTGSAPIRGSAVVTTEHPVWGHVAYVEQVKGDSIVVSEMNYDQFNKTNFREIPLDSPVIRGYIYPLEPEQ